MMNCVLKLGTAYHVEALFHRKEDSIRSKLHVPAS
jgi:hypothetical protein